MSIHPENRFVAGEYIIHNGPSVTTGDRSFSSHVNEVVEDTGDFITVDCVVFGRIYRFILNRIDWPYFVRCTAAMMELNNDIPLLAARAKSSKTGGGRGKRG